MPGKLRKEDIEDLEVLDRDELLSSGSTTYKSGVSVTSTTSGTKRVVISGFDLLLQRETPVEVGDKVTLSGTSGGAGDGTFTIAAIIDSNTFDVTETIGTSTGGSAAFKHPAGAKRIGFDPTGVTGTSATNLQDALKDVASNASGISEATHETLDTLVHNIAEGGSLHVTRDAQNRIQAATHRATSIPSSTKVRESTITRDGQGRISQVVEVQYDGAGAVITGQTLTKTIVRAGDGRISRVDTVES